MGGSPYWPYRPEIHSYRWLPIQVRAHSYLDDVLNMSERILDAFAAFENLDDVTAVDRDRLERLCALVQDVAHSTWSLRRYRTKEVQEILDRCPLRVSYYIRSDMKRAVSLETVGHRQNLGKTHETYWLEHGGSLDVADPDPPVLDAALFQRLCDEAIVEFITRSGEAYELRRCANDGIWYKPQIARRSRFCGPRCRQEFNNARISADESLRTFSCAQCASKYPIDNFSGLIRLEQRDGETDDGVRIGWLRDRRGGQLCVDCVIAEYPHWLRYVAPILASQRRGEQE